MNDFRPCHSNKERSDEEESAFFRPRWSIGSCNFSYAPDDETLTGFATAVRGPLGLSQTTTR